MKKPVTCTLAVSVAGEISRARCIVKVAGSLMVVVFFLANGLTIIGASTISSPVYGAFRNLFLLFGVFSYYETENHELRIWGSRGMLDANGKEAWTLISTEEHFPFSRGAAQSRLWASHHLRDLSRTEHWSVWQDMGLKIREKHNRMHPEAAITRIGFQARSWPRSSDGYYSRLNEARVTRFWVVATGGQAGGTETELDPLQEPLPFKE